MDNRELEMAQGAAHRAIVEKVKADAVAEVAQHHPELHWKQRKAQARALAARRLQAIRDAERAELICAGAGIRARIGIE